MLCAHAFVLHHPVPTTSTTMPKLTQHQRKAIGTAKHYHGMVEHLAAKYNVTRGTIQRWIQEGKKARPNWADQPGRGRKPVLSSVQKQGMKRSAEKRRSVKQITRRFNQNHTQTVSRSTVNRAVKGGRDPLTWQPATHGRKLSAANKKKRVIWARGNQRAHTGTWIYVDSKYLYIYEDGAGYSHRYWQKENKPPKVPWKSNPTVLHFYAAVGRGFKSQLHFVPPTPRFGSKQRKAKVNFASKHFIRAMKRFHKEVGSSGKVARCFKYILDHARQHTSRISKAAMAKAGVQLVKRFPAQSWDINIIENVWGVLDTKLVGCRARTPAGWRRGVIHAWDSISLDTINKLVGSVPDRLKHVAEKDGEWLCKKK